MAYLLTLPRYAVIAVSQNVLGFGEVVEPIDPVSSLRTSTTQNWYSVREAPIISL